MPEFVCRPMRTKPKKGEKSVYVKGHMRSKPKKIRKRCESFAVMLAKGLLD